MNRAAAFCLLAAAAGVAACHGSKGGSPSDTMASLISDGGAETISEDAPSAETGRPTRRSSPPRAAPAPLLHCFPMV